MCSEPPIFFSFPSYKQLHLCEPVSSVNKPRGQRNSHTKGPRVGGKGGHRERGEGKGRRRIQGSVMGGDRREKGGEGFGGKEEESGIP